MRNRLLGIAIVLVLVAAACGGGIESVTDAPGANVATDGSPTADAPDDDPAPSGGSDDAAPSDGTGGSDGQDAAGSYFDGALSQGYLQGNWCDSQGLTWVFLAGDSQVGRDQETLGLAAAIEKTFSEPGMKFVSQADNEFVVEQLGQQVTFKRGPCSGSSGDATGTGPDLSNVALCVLLDQYKDELTDLGGFQADPGEVFGGPAPFGGTMCSILIGTTASIDVVLFVGPQLTIEMVAADNGDAGPAPELGPEAVYVEATSHQTSDLALFPVRDGFVRAEATVGSASIPRANLIQIAQLLDLILRGEA